MGDALIVQFAMYRSEAESTLRGTILGHLLEKTGFVKIFLKVTGADDDYPQVNGLYHIRKSKYSSGKYYVNVNDRSSIRYDDRHNVWECWASGRPRYSATVPYSKLKHMVPVSNEAPAIGWWSKVPSKPSNLTTQVVTQVDK